MSSPSLVHQPARLYTTADPTRPSLQQQLSCLQSPCLTLQQQSIHHSMTTVLVVFRSAAWRTCLLSPSSASALPAGQSRWSALNPVLHPPSRSPSPHSRAVSTLTRASPVLASPMQGAPGSCSATFADIHHQCQLSCCFQHTMVLQPTCHTALSVQSQVLKCTREHGLAAYCQGLLAVPCCSKLSGSCMSSQTGRPKLEDAQRRFGILLCSPVGPPPATCNVLHPQLAMFCASLLERQHPQPSSLTESMLSSHAEQSRFVTAS